MRPNQQNNKQRSRGRNNGRRGGGGNPLSRNYESNGPDVKIRGNASHIAEKYTQLARDASASGDGVMGENYLQHAEHYNRIILAAQVQVQPRVDQSADEDEEAGVSQRFEPVRAESEKSERAEVGAEQPNASGPEEAEGQAQPSRPARQRRARKARETAGQGAGETPASDNAHANEGADGAPVAEAGEEDKPKRVRRPRRTKKDEAEPAAASQPELPAFLTAGREAAE